MREDSSTRSWDAVADDWALHADTNDYRNLLIMPFTLELLGEVRGRRILDLGCGEGGYSRALAARGARVVAVDGSRRLVEIARERADAAGQRIDFLVRNAAALDGIHAEAFDVVLASMSLMDVEDYEGSVREMWRVLARGGSLMMSITHPCFSAPVGRWVSEGQPDEHFAVDRYLQPLAWDAFMAAHFHRPIVRRHRPLQDYMNPLLECGFALREIHEPAATEEQAAKAPRLERLARIPYFLFMRWKKPEPPEK